MHRWVQDELAEGNLGDARLDRRLETIVERLGAKPSLSIPAACRDRAEIEATDRFMANPHVTPSTVLEPHRAATMLRMQKESVVLIGQDTTEIDLTRKRERVGGPLDDGQRWGLFAHPQLAFTPNAVPLGVVAAKFWARDPAEAGKDQAKKRKKRRAKPIQQKESMRWLDGYRVACELAEAMPQTQVVSLAEIESDVYECLAETGAADWIVRAAQNRALTQTGGLLRETLLQAPVLGHWEIAVSARDESTGRDLKRKRPRDARLARVDVRATRVALRPPHRPGQAALPVAEGNAVLVREVHPPPGEEPIEWLLLTTLPIATRAAVRRVVDYSKVRWGCEVFFRTLKSGCAIEDLQLEDAHRMMNCVAVYLVVAWRVLYVLMRGRTSPEVACGEAFDESEWKAVSRFVTGRLPESEPTLGELLGRVAILGGFRNRARDAIPGPKSLWIGLQRTHDLAAGWELAHATAKT